MMVHYDRLLYRPGLHLFLNDFGYVWDAQHVVELFLNSRPLMTYTNNFDPDKVPLDRLGSQLRFKLFDTHIINWQNIQIE